jgi:hypothetical protein
MMTHPALPLYGMAKNLRGCRSHPSSFGTLPHFNCPL